MMQSTQDFPPVEAILSGPHWLDRVRVVHVEPRGTTRVLIEAVTLDGQACLISHLLKLEDLGGLQMEAESDPPLPRRRSGRLPPRRRGRQG
jgi:hypothetical protein